MMGGMTGAEIKAARERKGWTQARLAEEVGVGTRTIGNWERGETVPKNRMGRLDAVLRDDAASESPRVDEATEAVLLAELMKRAARRAG